MIYQKKSHNRHKNFSELWSLPEQTKEKIKKKKIAKISDPEIVDNYLKVH